MNIQLSIGLLMDIVPLLGYFPHVFRFVSQIYSEAKLTIFKQILQSKKILILEYPFCIPLAGNLAWAPCPRRSVTSCMAW